MISQAVLDAQVLLELPARELMSLTTMNGAGIGARLGDIIQLFLLPLLPIRDPVPFAAPFA
jgi:hypothetical protein